MNNIKFVIILSVICFCSNACSNKKQSIKYVSINVSQLKQIIQTDTSNYKIVIFYDPLCESCDDYIRTVYKTLINKLHSESTRIYLIASQLNKPGIESIFRKNNIKLPAYYNIDSIYSFSKNDLHQIVKLIFPDINKIETFDVPFSLIIDKKNKLKTIKHKNENNEVEIYPLDLYDLKEISLTEIDKF